MDHDAEPIRGSILAREFYTETTELNDHFRLIGNRVKHDQLAFVRGVFNRSEA